MGQFRIQLALIYTLNSDSCGGDGLLSFLVINIFRTSCYLYFGPNVLLFLAPMALDIIPRLSLVCPYRYCISYVPAA